MEGVSNPKRVCIFTTFADISEAYSLNRVVQDQLKMLLDHGYTPSVIVAESFVPSGVYADPRITLKHIPNVPVHNEVKKDPSFDEDVAALETALESVLKDVDVVLTHDVIYQNAALKHNFAARKVAAKFPNLRWLHWIHSATSPVTLANLRPYFSDEYLNLVTTPFPNSFYIFFNYYSVPRVAKNFGVPESIVKVVPHPSDMQEVYSLSDNVYKIARERGFFQADVVCIYPIRLDRGKQVEMVIKTIACLKDFQLSVRLLVIDFHSTGGDKITYRDELKNIAIDWGLNSDEILWASELKEEWRAEIPHSDVMGFMRMSNVFIMPSVSESYSLVTQEAALNKCVVVLNQDFPPFRDIFGPSAIFRKYSSNMDVMADLPDSNGNTITRYGPNEVSDDERKSFEEKYHIATAGMIATELKNKNLALSTRLRQLRNLDYVFEHELQPLFF